MVDNPNTKDAHDKQTTTPGEEAHLGLTNLLSVFGQSMKHSTVDALEAGGSQVANGFHATDSSNNYFNQAQKMNHLHGAEKLAAEAGSVTGNALEFVGSTMVLSKVPFIGKLAPLAVGTGLGFLAPSEKDGALSHVGNAAIAAGTLSLMQFGPGKICDTLGFSEGKTMTGLGSALSKYGLSTPFRQELAATAVSGFAAGALNTELSTRLQTGHDASLGQIAMGGASWAGTGVAFQAAGANIAARMENEGLGRPRAGEVTLIGNRYSQESFGARDFLKKNHIDFKLVDPKDSPAAARLLAKNGLNATNEAMVILPDGKTIKCPDGMGLAQVLGMPTKPTAQGYDTIVIGAGPAGTQTAIYGSSEGLKTLLVDEKGPGGQAGTTSRVENFMGFQNGVTGPDLTGDGIVQAKRLGTEFIINKATNIERGPQGEFTVKLADGSTANARSIVLATGQEFRAVSDVPGMSELQNKGVYYGAALTEAPLIKPGETVYVVGGANSAGQAAVKFSELVGKNGKVVVLTRSPLEKSMSKYLIDQIDQAGNITVETGAQLKAAAGEGKLQSVTYTQGQSEKTGNADNMFVFIGSAPSTRWLPKEIATDQKGFIISGESAGRTQQWQQAMEETRARQPFANETSVPGVFTAGDVHAGTTKRIVVAAGDGANSLSQIHQYLTTPEAAPAYPGEAPLAAKLAPKVNESATSLFRPGRFWHPVGVQMSGLWGAQSLNSFALPLNVRFDPSTFHLAPAAYDKGGEDIPVKKSVDPNPLNPADRDRKNQNAG